MPGWASGNSVVLLIEYVSGAGVRRVRKQTSTNYGSRTTPFLSNYGGGPIPRRETPTLDVHGGDWPLPPAPYQPPPTPPAPHQPPIRFSAEGHALVAPGAGTLQAALDRVSAGDVLLLEDGEFYLTAEPYNGRRLTQGSGALRALAQPSPQGIMINQTVTIRAVNPGKAIIVGMAHQHVFQLSLPVLGREAIVTLDGLDITSQNVHAPRSDARPAPLPCNDLCTPSLP